MNHESPHELLLTMIPRVIDLRSEFEAQLRAIARLHGQLTKSLSGKDPANLELARVLSSELSTMLKNNKNIRDVLVELADVTGEAIATN